LADGLHYVYPCDIIKKKDFLVSAKILRLRRGVYAKTDICFVSYHCVSDASFLLRKLVHLFLNDPDVRKKALRLEENSIMGVF